MGILANLKTGWTLSMDSLSVLREHPKLLAFPAISGVATGLFFVFLYIGVFVGELIGGGVEYVALFVLYFVTTFVASFFTAALVHAVNDTFHEREPSIRRSSRAAWRMKGTIAVWSAIAAVVSLIIQQLEESDNPLSGLVASLFSVGWAVTTFFIIPVIVFEDVDLGSMFTRSAETFTDTWGETLGAGLGLGIIQLLLALGAIAIAALIALVIATVSPAAGIGVGILVVVFGLLAAYLIGQTIRGIAKTALYLYAREGSVPEQFTDFDFETLGGRAEHEGTPSHERVEG
ncbi:DUF6159 family protein [Natronomonas sp.]|uniref:DUF6159 family protein n=1 Tax=Natronomonas sp. TaxID=2184060 RepID=UPI002FC3231F